MRTRLSDCLSLATSKDMFWQAIADVLGNAIDYFGADYGAAISLEPPPQAQIRVLASARHGVADHPPHPDTQIDGHTIQRLIDSGVSSCVRHF